MTTYLMTHYFLSIVHFFLIYDSNKPLHIPEFIVALVLGPYLFLIIMLMNFIGVEIEEEDNSKEIKI